MSKWYISPKFTVDSLGKGGRDGFLATYRHVSPEVLESVRRYQLDLKTTYPDWMSKLDYQVDCDELRLHVFRRASLASALLQRPNTYGCR